MSSSYLLQALNATRKTYKKKKSGVFVFIFLSIVSFLGKCLFITKPMFDMYDLNIAKTTALYNEFDIAECFKGADSLNANAKVWLLGIIRGLFLVALVIVLGLICLGLFLVGVGIDELATLTNTIPNIIIPVIIIGFIVLLLTVSLFIPSKYVALYANDKSLFNILYCCKRSLSLKILVKYVFYYLFYFIVIASVPTALFFLTIYFQDVNFISIVLNIIFFILFIYVYAYAKLTKDTALYLLFRNNVSLQPKQNDKELTEEEKLTKIFN